MRIVLRQYFFSGNKKKCREVWPAQPIEYEKIFAVFLDMLLLVLPLLVLAAAYFLISKTLLTMDNEKQLVKQSPGKNTLSKKYLSLTNFGHLL